MAADVAKWHGGLYLKKGMMQAGEAVTQADLRWNRFKEIRAAARANMAATQVLAKQLIAGVHENGMVVNGEQEAETLFSRTSVGRNTSGNASVSVAAWPTSAAGLGITSVFTCERAFIPDKPCVGVAGDTGGEEQICLLSSTAELSGSDDGGGGGLLNKEAETLFSRASVGRNTSGNASVVLVAAWPTSAAGFGVTSGFTCERAFLPDKSCVGVSGDTGGEEQMSILSSTTELSGYLSGGTSFLGIYGEELERIGNHTDFPGYGSARLPSEVGVLTVCCCFSMVHLLFHFGASALYASIDEVGHVIESEAESSDTGRPPLLDSEGSEVGKPVVEDGDSSAAESLPDFGVLAGWRWPTVPAAAAEFEGLAESTWWAQVAEEANAGDEADQFVEELEPAWAQAEFDSEAELAAQRTMVAATKGHATYGPCGMAPHSRQLTAPDAAWGSAQVAAAAAGGLRSRGNRRGRHGQPLQASVAASSTAGVHAAAVVEGKAAVVEEIGATTNECGEEAVEGLGLLCRGCLRRLLLEQRAEACGIVLECEEHLGDRKMSRSDRAGVRRTLNRSQAHADKVDVELGELEGFTIGEGCECKGIKQDGIGEGTLSCA